MALLHMFVNKGTVKGPNSSDFDPKLECQLLCKSFKGLETDEKQVINVVGSHTNWQRQEIKKLYNQLYSNDLLDDIEDELGGHFLDLTLALFYPPHVYDAHLFRRAIFDAEADKIVLLEIICTRSNSDFSSIREIYWSEFGRNLDSDTANEVHEEYGRLIRCLMLSAREKSEEVDKKLAELDAHKLIAIGISQLVADEVLFNELLCLRNLPQLKATFEAYRRLSDKHFELDVRKEICGEIRDALVAIVKIAKSIPGYFAEKLHEAIKGADTDDETLIRIVVSRSEDDLTEIKKEFQYRFKMSLAKAIRNNCSGDYCRLLLKLVGS